MRILRLYPMLPPHSGGIEQHVVRLTQAQRALGVDVRVVFCFGEPTTDSDLRVGGAAVHRLHPNALRDSVFYFLAAQALRRERARADVIHVHGDWSAFVGGSLIARIVGARVKVGGVHGRLKEGACWNAAYGHILRSYDLCYSTGQLDAERLSRIRGRQALWITSGLHPIFQRAAEVPDPTPSESTLDVITVASLTEQKRVGLVLETARLLPQYTFAVVGEGPERGRLQAYIAKYGVRNVTLTGQLDVGRVYAAYRRSKVFLLTSPREGTPTAILEAMACGLPVVTTASNNFSALLEEGVTGHVIGSHTAADLAAKITTLLESDSLRQQMRETNRARARAFSWPAIAERITTVMARELYDKANRNSTAVGWREPMG